MIHRAIGVSDFTSVIAIANSAANIASGTMPRTSAATTLSVMVRFRLDAACTGRVIDTNRSPVVVGSRRVSGSAYVVVFERTAICARWKASSARSPSTMPDAPLAGGPTAPP